MLNVQSNDQLSMNNVQLLMCDDLSIDFNSLLSSFHSQLSSFNSPLIKAATQGRGQ